MKFKPDVYAATAITGRQGHDPPHEVLATYTRYTITVKNVYSRKKLCRKLEKLGIHLCSKRKTASHWIGTAISLQRIGLKKINATLYKKSGLPPSTIEIEDLSISSTA
jgi:hypothetical protein